MNHLIAQKGEQKITLKITSLGYLLFYYAY